MANAATIKLLKNTKKRRTILTELRRLHGLRRRKKNLREILFFCHVVNFPVNPRICIWDNFGIDLHKCLSKQFCRLRSITVMGTFRIPFKKVLYLTCMEYFKYIYVRLQKNVLKIIMIRFSSKQLNKLNNYIGKLYAV